MGVRTVRTRRSQESSSSSTLNTRLAGAYDERSEKKYSLDDLRLSPGSQIFSSAAFDGGRALSRTRVRPSLIGSHSNQGGGCPAGSGLGGGAMKRLMLIALYLSMIVILAGLASAETVAECQNRYFAQRKEGKLAYERETQACDRQDAKCLGQVDAKWSAVQQRFSDEERACRQRALSHLPPPPPIQWKPGDPSSVAPDGRRYIMSCSGKVLGLYKPGGALEMELKTHPGNCFPNDSPWLLPGSGARRALCRTLRHRRRATHGGKPTRHQPARR
jgi:hypothetical protein